MYGNIFCLPQKYPLIIEETLINGTVIERHINGKYNTEFLSKYVDSIGANNITIIIINKLEINDNGISETITDLGVVLLSDITFDIDVGYENVAITVKREEVGESKLKSPIPSVPRYLVIIILNIKPTNLPKIPPNNNINVDLIKRLSFIFLNIINYMIQNKNNVI